MANNRPKTRFVAIVEGKPRELLSISETSLDDITALIRREPHYGYLSGTVGMEFERYSVHVSPDSPGTTIKRTARLETGRVMTTAMFVKDSKTELFAPLFARRCPDMKNPHYDSKPRPRDTIISTGEFDPAKGALTYVLFVAHAGRSLPEIHAFNLYTASFRRFQLALYTTYTNVPAGPFSDYMIFATSPQQIDGIAAEGPVLNGVESMADEELYGLLLHSADTLGLKLLSHYVNPALGLPTDFTSRLMIHRLFFSRNPASAEFK